MIWTKKKPTTAGYYWLKMDKTDCFSEQPPRVVKVIDTLGYEGDLFILDGPEFVDGLSMEKASNLFDWSDQSITPPAVVGSCGCKSLEGAECSSCG